jgi:hypothetical protein
MWCVGESVSGGKRGCCDALSPDGGRSGVLLQWARRRQSVVLDRSRAACMSNALGHGSCVPVLLDLMGQGVILAYRYH